MYPRKLFTILFLLITIPVFSFAGNVLHGKITDNQGVSLPGAIIEITDLKTGAAADTGGNYIINNLHNRPKRLFKPLWRNPSI